MCGRRLVTSSVREKKIRHIQYIACKMIFKCDTKILFSCNPDFEMNSYFVIIYHLYTYLVLCTVCDVNENEKPKQYKNGGNINIISFLNNDWSNWMHGCLSNYVCVWNRFVLMVSQIQSPRSAVSNRLLFWSILLFRLVFNFSIIFRPQTYRSICVKNGTIFI